jgi:hypothetical protein
MSPFIIYLFFVCFDTKGLLEKRWHVMLNPLLRIFHFNPIPTTHARLTRPFSSRTSRTPLPSDPVVTVGVIRVMGTETLAHHPPTRISRIQGPPSTGTHPSPHSHRTRHPTARAVAWRLGPWTLSQVIPTIPSSEKCNVMCDPLTLTINCFLTVNHSIL